jgi:hypothetical protein
MILPLVLSLAMKLEIHANHDVSPMGLAQNYAMPGAIQEKLDVLASTDYTATFVPTRLANREAPFTMIEILYGPLFFTGMTIDMLPDIKTVGEGFTGNTYLSFSSIVPSFVFFVILFAMFAVIGWLCRNLNDALKFVLGITIAWLIWAILIALFSGLITRPVTDVVNQVLGRTDNPLHYSPRFWDAIGAPLRVFIVGMIYWVMAYFRTKKPAPESSLS